MESTKVNIQIWNKELNPNAQVWDDIKPITLNIPNPTEVAQGIADGINCSVRLTYAMEGVTDVGRLNGSYFVPKTDNVQ